MCRPVVVLAESPVKNEAAIHDLLQRRAIRKQSIPKPNIAVGVVKELVVVMENGKKTDKVLERMFVLTDDQEVVDRFMELKLLGWRSGYGSDIGEGRVRKFEPSAEDSEFPALMEIFSRVGNGEYEFYTV